MEPCDGCEQAFDVRYYLTDGDPSACQDPDVPGDDETRTLGWASLEDTVYDDVEGTGVWVPWYDATLEADTLTLSWSVERGVLVEDSG